MFKESFQKDSQNVTLKEKESFMFAEGVRRPSDANQKYYIHKINIIVVLDGGDDD